MTRPASRLATFHESTPALRVLKWVVAPLVVIHVVLASISGYRAIVQVYQVDIALASPTLSHGSAVRLSVATSGRTPVDAELELIQSTHAETLAVLLIPDHENASYDPRTIHAAKSVLLTSERLARFQPGPAILRATANGRSQWLRVPPPVVAERSVDMPTVATSVASKPLGVSRSE
jgi:hypothetical protein